MDYTMSEYELLNNKIWLEDQYLNKKISAKRISEFVGCKTSNSVRQALIKFDIPLRSYRDAQIIGRDDNLIIDEEVLSGTLLGDGSLQKSSKTSSTAAPYYTKKCKWEDYSLHIGKYFNKSGDINLSFQEQFLQRNKWNSVCEYYVFRTLSSNLLIPWYEKWYPSKNNYKKVVPIDLILTPKIILYWFLDDGYSTWRNREKEKYKQNTKQVICGFCSESFTKQENEFLCKELKKLNINSSVRKCNSGGSGWRIFIDQFNTNNFFNLIGNCPVDSMKYKWKIV